MREEDKADSAVLHAAISERIMLAEKHIAFIRVIVIVFGTITWFFLDHARSVPQLVYPLLVIIWLYGIYVLVLEPYRKYHILTSAWFTFTGDSVFATLWLFATGGIYSPYYLMLYTSITAVAVRFSIPTTMMTATLYSACYILLLLGMDQWKGNEIVVVIRAGFIYILGLFTGIIMKETQTQLNAKHIIKAFNARLEAKVEERTRELEESIKRIEKVIEIIPQMAWISQPDGVVTYFNNAWRQFAGTSDPVNWDWKKLVFPEDYQRTKELWRLSLETGKEFEVENRLIRYDGSVRWMLERANPVKNSYGKILFWIGSATDIHDRKMQEEKKDYFMSIASHELKTPLTTMKAYVQLLDSKLYENGELGSYVKKVSAMVERLNGLVAELLDVSKIQMGKLQLQVSEFDFDTLIKECIENVQHHTETHQIILSGVTHSKVKGDRQRLEQVMNNYLTNAIKYSPKADKVLVNLMLQEEMVKVAVTDFGIGISQNNLLRIFERFYRVEGSEAQFQGLGIGLYIASEIIRRHGGNTWVESNVGKGSTFYFSLPRL